jgi:hypothetical protein
MISGIWLLCRWLLSEVVRRSISLSQADTSLTHEDITSLYQQLQRLYFSLYSHAIDYRKNIIQFLFKSCHSQLPYLQDRPRHLTSSSPLAPVAILLANSQQQSGLSLLPFDPNCTKQHAKFSCFLLEGILRGYPTEANEIFSSLSHRIHSSFYSMYERSSLDDKRGHCQLPPPFVLHRFSLALPTLRLCFLSLLTQSHLQTLEISHVFKLFTPRSCNNSKAPQHRSVSPTRTILTPIFVLLRDVSCLNQRSCPQTNSPHTF